MDEDDGLMREIVGLVVVTALRAAFVVLRWCWRAWTRGAQPGIYVRLSELDAGRPTVIGRSRECDLVLTDQFASRQHAEIAVESGRWMLRDLKSRNGTYYRGWRVIRRTEIGTGGVVRIGGTRVHLRP